MFDKPAADHDRIGIEDVDDAGDGAREAVVEILHDGACHGVARRGERGNVVAVQVAARAPLEIGAEAGAADPGFDAADAAAIALRRDCDFTVPSARAGDCVPIRR